MIISCYYFVCFVTVVVALYFLILNQCLTALIWPRVQSD